MRKNLLYLLTFGISMGFLEAAVVIYLRALYYPAGFKFPMSIMPVQIIGVELCRELSTLIMLFSIAWIAGKKLTERFAYFIYSFAIWDIFYYVFLYIFIGWPESLFTWDLLFLIPITWTGPVVAPIIVSLTFILMAIVILQKYYKSSLYFSKIEWSLVIAGMIVLFFSFIQDYSSYMFSHVSFFNYFKSSHLPEIMIYSNMYVPVKFNWWLFIIGEILLLIPIYIYRRKN
jgi:hypothetical protein